MTYSQKLKDPRWQKKRLEILNRDEFTCRICGDDTSTLHVHHVSYSGNPWDVENNLLLTVCESCHEEETMELKQSQTELIKALKSQGFMSMGMHKLSKVFKRDRGWMFYEPAFDVLKMIIEDDVLWKTMEEEFWKRLSERLKQREKLNKNG